MKRFLFVILVLLPPVVFIYINHKKVAERQVKDYPHAINNQQKAIVTEQEIRDDFFRKLVLAAIERTEKNVTYDPSYIRIDYPNGDVPDEVGVCADVIIRCYRKAGIDLQKEVHEDMKRNFSKYPQKWGLKGQDSNIDHRRVPNLMTYFKRMGAELNITDKPENYKPGDIVAWDFGKNRTHIGLVINLKSYDGRRNLIVHNCGGGPKAEDVLFGWKIIGHYRYKKQNSS